MVRYIREQEVRKILTMPKSIELMEQAFRDRALGRAFDIPRQRARQPGASLNVLQGAAPQLNIIGFKASYTRPDTLVSMLHLHDHKRGNLLAMIESDWMGMMRTGAASGLATRLLARTDASVVACFGTGRHGVTQLEAICAVRDIKLAQAYGRNQERLNNFCSEMSAKLKVEVRPMQSTEQTIAGAHIINVMTRARTPVFDGKLLEPGQHINATGVNALDRCEIDLETIKRSAVIVVDSREVARNECGDLLPALEAGLLYWENIPDLADLVIGRRPGRISDTDITLFESQGMCIEDLYVGKYVLDVALEKNIGVDLPIGD